MSQQYILANITKMIGLLKGKIVIKSSTSFILLAGNVGYEVNGHVSFAMDTEVQVFVYTSVKENEISLWGFEDRADLDLFKLLINISGVGCKTAMNLINKKGRINVLNSIATNNINELKGNGIGNKTAQKIVMELEDKISTFNYSGTDSNQGSEASSIKEEIIETMKSLGYKYNDIQVALEKMIKENKDTLKREVQEIIKDLFKYI